MLHNTSAVLDAPLCLIGTDDWEQWTSVAASVNITYKGAHGIRSELYWLLWLLLAFDSV